MPLGIAEGGAVGNVEGTLLGIVEGGSRGIVKGVMLGRSEGIDEGESIIRALSPAYRLELEHWAGLYSAPQEVAYLEKAKACHLVSMKEGCWGLMKRWHLGVQR
jgi:hypothetical protein